MSIFSIRMNFDKFNHTTGSPSILDLLWRSHGVPWFVLLSKECFCKWEKYGSFINRSHSQALSWWCWAEHLRGWRCSISHYLSLILSCYLRAEFLLSYSPMSILSSEDCCFSYSWDQWKDWIYLQHRSLLHSLHCFPFQIFWRPPPTYLLSSFL